MSRLSTTQPIPASAAARATTGRVVPPSGSTESSQSPARPRQRYADPKEGSMPRKPLPSRRERFFLLTSPFIEPANFFSAEDLRLVRGIPHRIRPLASSPGCTRPESLTAFHASQFAFSPVFRQKLSYNPPSWQSAGFPQLEVRYFATNPLILRTTWLDWRHFPQGCFSQG